MPSQHPKEIGYGYVIERYVTRKDSDHPRYLELNSARVLRPGWPHAKRFARHLIDDAATITDAELEALLAYEWRSRLTAAWLIGVDRRESFRKRIGDLLMASEVCYSGGAYCFALARFGTHADAEILTTYLDRYLPAPTCTTTSPTHLAPSSTSTPASAPTTPTASRSPTASGTTGARAWDASATPATPPPSCAAGRTSTATSPTDGPARNRGASAPEPSIGHATAHSTPGKSGIEPNPHQEERSVRRWR
ncbi:hypothetical protein GCM10010215_43480 [Streptomyces virginiae]|uniref:Uncharacterized protein n=1 Tax=Streptomyces virginiae TaxID=1961 RepID=A0ABQ3NDV6_STRVG|nr:hypothetical protein GCM10010215_43480 [Streptomyces virginiae]GHI10959.1 hypothetical protein Scinn_04220 [Streptomyces virginiae]